jgi:hypothetical protein
MRDDEGRAQVLGLDTKCPYVQDAAQEPRLLAYARRVNRLLGEPALSGVLSKNPGLINRYQDDVRPVGRVGGRDD